MCHRYQILFFLLLATTLPAQQDTLLLTLSEAQELAIQNNTRYQRNLIDGKIAEKRVEQIRNLLYPQWEADLDIRYYIERPVSLLPGETVNKPDEVIAIKLGSDIGYSPALEVSQVVYDAQLLKELELSKMNTKEGELQAAATAAEVKWETVISYLNVVTGYEREAQLLQTRERLQQTLEEVQVKVNAGILNKIETARVRLSIDNQNSAITKARQTTAMSEQLLKYTLHLPPEQPILLTERFFDVIEPVADPDRQGLEPTSLEGLPAIQLQLFRIDQAHLRIEQQQKAVLPIVSLYGRLGVIAINKEFDEASGKELSWFFNSYIGLRTQWQINSMYDNKSRISELQLQLRQSELELQALQNESLIAITRAQNNLMLALEDYRMEQRKEAFARQELDYLTTRFRNDLSSSKDVIKAEEDLSVAQRASLVAWLQYLASKYDLMHANGEF